ncbi:FHA domain-containing protein [Dictyobacter aurantiacus]|uniref:FHA domain-containing protein n=1 Tax=Dictyobacter aurantiacus TaxID=1936993 RepID=A0A401ZB73_9CHLR|nr:FHA domain-containing protein [Dictyobacter aurantiacus]GCE03978.1 hypothetical protein KDAU_13070 [Dictyobacter aurantiacus]
MREPYLTIFAALGSLVPMPVLIGAIIAVAVILALGGVFLWRSNKGKTTKPPIGSAGASDWQRQGQPGAWNQNQPQGSSAWNQQGGQGQNPWGTSGAGAQQNSWGGAAGAPAQQQQQQANANPWGASPAQPEQNPWGAPSPSQPAWGNAQQPQPQSPAQGANPWGASPAQPEQNPWGASNNPAQPAANQPWGAASPSQPGWGNQGNQGNQAPWNAQGASAPAQDPWGAGQQGQSGSGQQWGAPAANAAPQQAQTAYGGNPNAGWNQPQQQPQQQADPWGAPNPKPPSAPFANPSAVPPWQQPNQGGFGQDPNAMYGGSGADNDKTMLRSQGPQMGVNPQMGGGVGFVRVEEGKEPGRIYEIRKESLSMGRSRESDIFLEDLAVSRLHASLVNMGNGSYALKDEGSANGTKVNGQLVNKFQTYPLQEGDRIQLGQTVLVFAKK